MPSVEDLLKQAEDHVDRFELQEALDVCKAVLNQDSISQDALQLYASILIELGQIETAREALQKAVQACPNTGYEKFLALAQLSCSTEALGYYSEAARILKEVVFDKGNDADEVKDLRRQLSGVYCAAAELYLTDLCFEEDAEARCEELVSEALLADPTNPETFRLRAEVFLGQEKQEEAKTAIVSCVVLWKDLPADDLQYPSYEQRIAMVKVLLEVSMFEEASFILEALLEEDDCVIDTWYLLGIAQISLQDNEGAIEALVSAMALLVRMPVEEVDEDQKESIFGFLKGIGVDAPKIWADLEAELKSHSS